MTFPMDSYPVQTVQKRSMLLPILVGCGAFAVGTAVTFGVVQWQSQKQQLALMSQMVLQMQQAPQTAQVAVPVATQQDVATRNAPLDLLEVTPPTTASQAPAEVVQVAVATPVPDEQLSRTTADKIRALVSRSSDPLVSAALAQDAARRETMSVAIQGVNELVDAAVAGDYALSTLGEDGKLGISFEGHREDQRELELLLASAAQADMIAFNASVRGSDGSYDGKIILYDLVERALINGNEAERRTGAQMQQEALALLGRNNPAVAAAEPASDGGKTYRVQAGDSLAYIALQFYGNTNGYQRIFQANRDKLSSPDKIQIGQKLVIPSA